MVKKPNVRPVERFQRSLVVDVGKSMPLVLRVKPPRAWLPSAVFKDHPPQNDPCDEDGLLLCGQRDGVAAHHWLEDRSSETFDLIHPATVAVWADDTRFVIQLRGLVQFA